MLKLSGCKIFIVEDDFFLADDLAQLVRAQGAEVIGPMGSLDEATALLEQRTDIDLAILDINLRGDLAYTVADILRAGGVPLILVTGYDPCSVPDTYQDIPRLQKPLDERALLEWFDLLHGRAKPAAQTSGA